MLTLVREVHFSELPEKQRVPSQAEDFETGLVNAIESLRRSAHRLMRNEQNAEDLLQETLLRAWQHADTYERGTNLRAWLFRILGNTAINLSRKAMMHPTVSLSAAPVEDLECSSQVQIGAEEEFLQRQFDGDIVVALGKLSARFRLIIWLIDIEGLSYKEAAEQLQIPLGTVMSRVYRARRQLRGYLSSYACERGYVTEA